MSGDLVVRPDGHPAERDGAHTPRLAIVGCGAMGEALLAGWLAAGWRARDIAVVEQSADRLAGLRSVHGVRGVELPAAGAAETLVLGIKPHQVVPVLEKLAPHLDPHTLVVSIAAGVPLRTLAAALPEGQPIVRVMPNTPALVQEGMAGVVPGPRATAEHLGRVVSLMEAVGQAVVIDESQIDALTALSGSGPAYVFLMAEAMVEAGVHQGLTRDVATRLVNQTLLGAATMLVGSADQAATLRERVTSPGGTTAAALREFEERGFRAAVLGAVEECASRSREMARDQ